MITWDIGTLAAGETRTETIPPVVTSTIPEGTIIQFMAFAFDGIDSRSDAVKAVIVSNRPDISIDSLSKSFGGVVVGSSSDQTVTITNNGNEDLDINSMSGLAAPFTIPTDNCSGETLLAGENCTFTMRFSPTATGPFDDTLFISSNDPNEGSVGVSVDGTGVAAATPDITVTDAEVPTDDLQVPFGSITVNTNSDKIVTVTNDGTASLDIGTITGISAPFSIQNDNCSDTTLAENANCALTLRFEPTGTGAFSDTLEIPSNDPDENPVSVSVDGTGLAAPTPDITVSDSLAPTTDLQVPFASLTVGGTSDETVTVSNDGSADLKIDTVAFANALAAPFNILNDVCSGLTLAAGESCSLTVRFSPTATGTFNDTFDIPSNDPDEDPVTVMLSGTGLAIPTPEITVTDSVAPMNDLQVPFGDVTEANTSTQTVTVQNDGNAALNIGALGTPAAPFSILSDTCSGMSLAPSASCDLTVEFSPTATGLFNDSFGIPSDDSDENPVIVNVSGTGVAMPVPDITVTDSFAPANDLQIPFADLAEGNTVDQTITIKNDGNANLLIGTIAAIDVISAPFGIQNDACSGSTLLPGGSCTLTVGFSPTSTGAFNDSFDIPSDDPDENSVIVNVSGTGLPGGSNNPPTAPELVFPADGETGLAANVTFGWNESTDPDGDSITYALRVCEDAALSVGCVSPAGAVVNKTGTAFAGLGFGLGLMGLVFLGGAGGRKRVGFMLAMIFLSGTLLSACNSGGGGGNPGGGNPTADIEETVNGLKPGTTYHWKVTADDGNGGTAGSETWSFTTQ